MAYRFTVEIVVGQVEAALISENQINIPELCVESIRDRLNALNTMRTAVDSVNSRFDEVQALKAEVTRLTGALQARKVPDLKTLQHDKHVGKVPTITQKMIAAEAVIHGKKKLLTVEDLYE